MSLANELYSYKLSVLATDFLSCHHRYAVVQTYDIYWANDTTSTIQEGMAVSCCRNGLVYTLCNYTCACIGPRRTVYVQLKS